MLAKYMFSVVHYDHALISTQKVVYTASTNADMAVQNAKSVSPVKNKSLPRLASRTTGKIAAVPYVRSISVPSLSG